jgi:aminoglycoside phosphotransferase (APT) family kinase protein
VVLDRGRLVLDTPTSAIGYDELVRFLTDLHRADPAGDAERPSPARRGQQG